MDYRTSGVDIAAGEEVVQRIRAFARSTYTPGVLSEIGSFGGLFALAPGRSGDQVLVASADGVGTKLKIAFVTGRHETIGEDLVNHCVNDILVQGAEPIFFLDYLATGRLSPDVALQVVDGLARACRENQCALLGGETAEMPGFYSDGEYDLAGFIVGVVERQFLIDGSRLEPGDVLLGLPSSGLHTNGYSLARRIVFDALKLSVASHVAELDDTVGNVLLQPHRSYLSVVRPLLRGAGIKAMAHITGGGITGNLPRVLPAGTAAVVQRAAWPVPEVFGWLQRNGDVSDEEMFRTFNMGIGLILGCAPGSVDGILQALDAAGEANARLIGRVVEGERTVGYV